MQSSPTAGGTWACRSASDVALVARGRANDPRPRRRPRRSRRSSSPSPQRPSRRCPRQDYARPAARGVAGRPAVADLRVAVPPCAAVGRGGAEVLVPVVAVALGRAAGGAGRAAGVVGQAVPVDVDGALAALEDVGAVPTDLGQGAFLAGSAAAEGGAHLGPFALLHGRLVEEPHHAAAAREGGRDRRRRQAAPGEAHRPHPFPETSHGSVRTDGRPRTHGLLFPIGASLRCRRPAGQTPLRTACSRPRPAAIVRRRKSGSTGRGSGGGGTGR